jgi:hypothetical protein
LMPYYAEIGCSPPLIAHQNWWKKVWVPVTTFYKIFISSSAFDGLLCWNWPFSPLNCLTLWITMMYRKDYPSPSVFCLPWVTFIDHNPILHLVWYWKINIIQPNIKWCHMAHDPSRSVTSYPQTGTPYAENSEHINPSK